MIKVTNFFPDERFIPRAETFQKKSQKLWQNLSRLSVFETSFVEKNFCERPRSKKIILNSTLFQEFPRYFFAVPKKKKTPNFIVVDDDLRGNNSSSRFPADLKFSNALNFRENDRKTRKFIPLK